MATLKKRNGNYSLRFVETIDGQRREAQISLQTKSVKIANQLKSRLEADQQLGKIDVFDNFSFFNWKNPKTLTLDRSRELSNVIDDFLNDKVELNDKTRRNYTYLLENFKDHVGATMFFHLIEKEDVQSFVFRDSLTVSSQNNYLRHLKVFFRWAEKNGYRKSIVEDISRKQVPENLKDQIISEQQLKKIIDAHSKYIKTQKEKLHISTREQYQLWFEPLIQFAFYTGLRLNEITHLKWKHINLKDNEISVVAGKGGKSRTVLIFSKLKPVLKKWNSHVESTNERFVFESVRSSSNKSIKMEGKTVSSTFKQNVLRAGLDSSIHFHSLRHSCATFLLKTGFSVYEVQKILGHTSITITERYLHLIPDDLKQKAKKLGLLQK